MGFTTDELIESIKQEAMIPASQNLWTDAAIIGALNQVMRQEVVPLVLKCREEHWVTYEDQAALNIQRFPIPYRAIGSKLRDLKLVTANGDELLTEEMIGIYELNQTALITQGRRQFRTEGNDVVFMKPLADVEKSVRMYFYLRPSELVLLAETATITAINTVTNTVTVSALPTTLGLTVDLVAARSPYQIRAYDKAVTVNGLDITFTSLPTGLMVGDYVCKAGEAPVPQLPVEIIDIFTDMAAMKIVKSLGDSDAVAIRKDEIKGNREAVTEVMDNRVIGKPKTLAKPMSTYRSCGWGRGQ